MIKNSFTGTWIRTHDILTHVLLPGHYHPCKDLHLFPGALPSSSTLRRATGTWWATTRPSSSSGTRSSSPASSTPRREIRSPTWRLVSAAGALHGCSQGLIYRPLCYDRKKYGHSWIIILVLTIVIYNSIKFRRIGPDCYIVPMKMT